MVKLASVDANYKEVRNRNFYSECSDPLALNTVEVKNLRGTPPIALRRIGLKFIVLRDPFGPFYLSIRTKYRVEEMKDALDHVLTQTLEL
jgi:hypothetical protein